MAKTGDSSLYCNQKEFYEYGQKIRGIWHLLREINFDDRTKQRLTCSIICQEGLRELKPISIT